MRHAGNLESVLTYEGTSEVRQLAIGQGADPTFRLPVNGPLTGTRAVAVTIRP
jgi:hypothetical protein